jgi:hypothetical protein
MLEKQELQNREALDLSLYRRAGTPPKVRTKKCLGTQCVSLRRDGHVYPCVAGHPVWRDNFLSGRSAAGQRDCTSSSLTRFCSALVVL